MLSAGQQIGPYTLARKLGRGGFGEVWLAERQSQFFTKKVAIKLPHDEQVDFETIRREAVLWEQASGHPNVLPIIDADVYQGQVVIVSEYAEGGSLADKLKAEGKLQLKESVEMTIGILNGLEFLHSKNIIHRDIKPGNVLLQGNTPRLADFGISRAMNTSTISSVVVGTDAYMSPEAFDGKRNVQTDIWSVGVLLYQLLKGKLPFSQEHPSERMFAVLTKEFEPLPEEVPPDLKRIVQKALAKNPAERFQSAREMREVLQRALVGIQYPTAAPTELLRQPPQTPPPSAPVLQPPLSPPPPQTQTQNNAPPVQTNDRSIQTHVQTPPPEKETGQYARPPVETPPFSAPASMVTQISQLSTGEASKPLLTVAQSFADKTRAPRKSKKLFFILPAVAFLALAVIIGGGYFFLKSKAGVISRMTLPPVEASKLIPYRKGDKWGYSDAQKRIYIEPKFSSRAEPFSEDLALVGAEANPFTFGYIDKSGNFVIKLDFNGLYYAESFSEGLAKGCSESNKCGFIDKTGNWVIQPKYKYAYSFSDGLSRVCVEEVGSINESCGFIDKSGKEVIPLKYFDVSSFSEGLAAVSDKTNAETTTINGKKAYLSLKTIFIDKSGKTFLQPKESSPAPFSEGLSVVGGTGSYYARYIDKSGKVILQTDYWSAHSFSESLAGVSNGVGTKWGFIDKTGNLVIPLQYDSVGSFSEGLAMVEINKKCGFIDKTGKIIIPLKYDCYSSFDVKFKNGIAKVAIGESSYNNKEFYIGKDGTEYYEP